MDENTQETTPQDAAPGAQVVASEAEWKARVAGLDKKVTEVVAKNRELESLLANQMMKEKEFTMSITDRDGKLKDYETQVAKWQKDSADAESRAANLAKVVERQKLFMGPEHADLAQFEAKGLLRTDLDGEALTDYLKQYREVLGQTKTAAISQTFQGATGGGAGAQKESAANLDTLHAQFNEAMKNRDIKSARALELQILEVSGKQ